MTREQLEVKKLEAEVAALTRSWWRQPAYLAILIPSFFGIVTACVGFASGYFSSLQERLRSEQALLKIDQHQIEILRDSARYELANLVIRRDGLTDILNYQISMAQHRIDSLMAYGEVRDSVQIHQGLAFDALVIRNRSLLNENRTYRARSDSLMNYILFREIGIPKMGGPYYDAGPNGSVGENSYYMDSYEVSGFETLESLSGAFRIPIDTLIKDNDYLESHKLSKGMVLSVRRYPYSSFAP